MQLDVDNNTNNNNNNNNNIDNNNNNINNFEYLNWIDTSTYEKLLSTCVQYKLKNVKTISYSC